MIPTRPAAPPAITLAERNRADGTTALLRTGSSVLTVGVICMATIYLFLGGIGRNGPHSNTGWFLLIVTLMSLPFGLMLSALGAAKWLRNHGLAKAR